MQPRTTLKKFKKVVQMDKQLLKAVAIYPAN